MKIFISPAKSMDLTSKTPVIEETQPHFINESNKLNSVLKKKSVKSLSGLMHLSEKLSRLNWERNQNFKTPFTTENSRPAIFTFNGDVYFGLDAFSLPKKKFTLLQDNLRIISGLYGILRPFDLIQPYRLEMGTPLKVGSNNNLYEYWTKKITDQIINEVYPGEIIVDLASKEYSSVINFKSIKNRVISPVFKDFKNGKFKIISFYAKKARGVMSRFLIETAAKSMDDILKFSENGYSFSNKDSIEENFPVFIR
ncbi:MAG: peroxide stress protein YaaA [Flavobacteriaceae bacterium]|nr:peroxide stress protein YaaA [Flavobacteriaceae bacterium]